MGNPVLHSLFWDEPLSVLVQTEDGILLAELADYDACELGSLALALRNLQYLVREEAAKR